MDKQNATRLLDETFNADFEITRFAKFIRELFNSFELNQKSWTVWTEYQDYIESYSSLGSYTDKTKKIIDVLIVKLKRTSSRDRARTMQRNFIAKYLGNSEKDAALVAFYGDDEDWRFSFVKMEYNLMKNEAGKAKVSTELTPAKRYSFLVGVNEPNHTCKSQFVNLLMQEEFNPTLEEIESAFSIDKVSKEFFFEYKELYLKLKEAVEKFIKKDKNIREEFENKAISTVDFTKKLLGQIIFIYFLQKKGWLGVEKDKGKFKDWGTGPKNFLRKLFEKKKYENFFNDVLELLFYEALATERDDDYYSKFECKIPFLNGGLFEPINDYNWRETDLLLDNSIFERILNTFDRYNFTVKEDEPLEKEVAIDPEMLGKVFENLIEENIRKGQGAYYTPREIVHYMCKQSLINYLETNTGIAREDIEKFILLGDFALDILIKEKEKIRQYGRSYITDEEHKLSKSIRENYAKIDELMQNIKIVDPAVGSGAFPVGMMNEIVKARSILSIFFSDEKQRERTNYNLKREVIENCLYGVDIDSSAVDIAKLRFWLSLIVDETNIKNIKPLPNLDYKIVCGNSLLEEFEGVRLFDERLMGDVEKKDSSELNALINQENQIILELRSRNIDKKKYYLLLKRLNKISSDKQKLIMGNKQKIEEKQSALIQIPEDKIRISEKKLRELKELHKKFLNEQNKKMKKQYRADIEKIEWDLIEETLKEQNQEESLRKLNEYKKNKAKPFFLWKLYFIEIFERENPGFDIIIANPPYISSKGIDENFKDVYTRVFGFADDTYNYFFVKSFDLSRTGGVIAFISSNTYFTINSKLNLRELFQANKIIGIFNVGDVFEVPLVDTAINITQKKDCAKLNYEFVFKDGRSSFYFPRVYSAQISIYRNAVNKVIFTPSPLNMQIYNKYNDKVKNLLLSWWQFINSSKDIEKNTLKIEKYRASLKSGDLTIMGLITEGGQGLATADNGRFIALISTSKLADNIKNSRPRKIFELIKNYKIKELQELASLNDIDMYLRQKSELQIAQIFDDLKHQYGRDIFGKGYLYKIIKPEQVADISMLSEHEKKLGINRDKPHFVRYDKGDKEGNQWYLDTPFYIDWSTDSVNWLKENSGKKGQGMPVMRNSQFYFREGFCWILTLNEFSQYQKARIKEPGVFDVNAMTLIPALKFINSKYLVCLINSFFIYHYKFNFINNTSAFQINDARQIPIIIPDITKLKEFETIFDEAYKTKKKQSKQLLNSDEENKILMNIQKKLDKLVYDFYNIETKEK